MWKKECNIIFYFYFREEAKSSAGNLPERLSEMYITLTPTTSTKLKIEKQIAEI